MTSAEASSEETAEQKPAAAVADEEEGSGPSVHLFYQTGRGSYEGNLVRDAVLQAHPDLRVVQHPRFACGGAMTVTLRNGAREQVVWSNAQSSLSEISDRRERSLRSILSFLDEALAK